MPDWVDGKVYFYADSGPRRLMDLFSVKWSSMVLHALWHWPEGRARPGELQRSLQGISKKMLLQTLKELEIRGLIHRRVFQVIPPKVEYSLTPLGKTSPGRSSNFISGDWNIGRHWMRCQKICDNILTSTQRISGE